MEVKITYVKMCLLSPKNKGIPCINGLRVVKNNDPDPLPSWTWRGRTKGKYNRLNLGLVIFFEDFVV